MYFKTALQVIKNNFLPFSWLDSKKWNLIEI